MISNSLTFAMVFTLNFLINPGQNIPSHNNPPCLLSGYCHLEPPLGEYCRLSTPFFLYFCGAQSVYKIKSFFLLFRSGFGVISFEYIPCNCSLCFSKHYRLSATLKIGFLIKIRKKVWVCIV